MLIIRQAQLEALRQGMLIRTLSESHAAARRSLGKRGFRARVLGALEAAASLGLSDADQQRRYASLCLSLGEAFPEGLPWATTILGWDVPPAERLAALERGALEEQLRGAGGGEGGEA